MIARERITRGAWLPPWLRHQHEARYDWAALRAAGNIVLDIACANGYGSAVLAAHSASRVVAADIAMEPLVEARTRNNVDVLCASVLRLPFPDATFDLVVSLETIEHVRDDGAYVAEIRRVVKDDGVLICSTPNRAVLNPGRALSDRPFNPFHVREYTAPELEGVLRTCFPVVTLFGQTPYNARYVGALAVIGRRFPMLAVRLHQFRKLAGIPFERRARHEPRPTPFAGAEAEVLIAVASQRGL